MATTPPRPASAGATPPRPPVARRVRVVHELHGDRRIDDYHWLRERDAAEVRAHLEAENAYTAAVMEPTRPLQDRLYREMVARIQETDASVPYRDGAFFHYVRTEQGKQYPIHCRRADASQAAEQVVLDLNALAEGEAYMGLGVFEPSDDGRFLAYSTDVTGFRDYTLHVKDLDTGALLEERWERAGTVAWAADGKTLFYTLDDEAKRPHRLFRHRLGTPVADDVEVLEEPDEMFRLYVGRTRSRALIVTVSASHTTSECRFFDAARPGDEPRLVVPRRPEHEYDVDHHGEHLYIRTNDAGRNFRVVRAPVSAPDSWSEVVPRRDGVMIEQIDLFRDHLVLSEREDGLPQLRVRELGGGAEHRVAFPEPAYTVHPTGNHEFDTGVLRYTYESLVSPPSVYDYDMHARRATLRKRQPVLGGYDADAYVCERLHATAPDGTRVPISLVRRRDSPPGPGPLLLYGYGAYGISIPAGFSSARLSLLERGVAWAIAHVRGGGELGKPWHDQGRLRAKPHTFSDFAAAAECLIAEGRTAPDRLVAEGGSAGGLLIGAVLNQRPELFRAAVAHVPFVDVLTTMQDATLPLTVGEWEEWGDPRDPDDYACIRSYCPYSNLARGAYPALLVKTSLFDSQVMYWEPAKYVARLRTLKTDDRPLLLQTNLAAGHHGASGRYDHLREVAFDYAFVLWQLGIETAGTTDEE